MISEIVTSLGGYVGDIVGGTEGIIGTFQAMNQKPDILDTLTGIFTKIAELLSSFGDVIAELMKFAG